MSVIQRCDRCGEIISRKGYSNQRTLGEEYISHSKNGVKYCAFPSVVTEDVTPDGVIYRAESLDLCESCFLKLSHLIESWMDLELNKLGQEE